MSTRWKEGLSKAEVKTGERNIFKQNHKLGWHSPFPVERLIKFIGPYLSCFFFFFSVCMDRKHAESWLKLIKEKTKEIKKGRQEKGGTKEVKIRRAFDSTH